MRKIFMLMLIGACAGTAEGMQQLPLVTVTTAGKLLLVGAVTVGAGLLLPIASWVKKCCLKPEQTRVVQNVEKVVVSREVGKPVGFVNQGHSCYLTAGVLVPLLHSPRIVKALLDKGETCNDPVIKQFSLLAKQMYVGDILPESLRYPDLNHAFCRKFRFQEGQQNDAFEALDAFLDHANKFLGIPLTFMRISACAECGTEKMIYNEQRIQFLTRKSMEEGLREYFGRRDIVFNYALDPQTNLIPEQNISLEQKIKGTLTENENVIKDRCPKCTVNPKLPVETKSYSTLMSLPVLLCVGVERSQLQGKCMDPIKIPDTLSVEAFCSDELLKSLKNPDATTYELKALTVHRGPSIDDGHYISYVKDGKWWQVNDRVVSDKVVYGFDLEKQRLLFKSADEVVKIMTSGESLPGAILKNDTPVIAVYEQKQA
jgi:uncharacterized UBP type Zn finger protein